MVMGKRDAKKKWKEHDAIVLDEVSIINGELLDKLDAVGRAVRGGGLNGVPHPLPFGAGAYTRPLFRSASAISDTNYTLSTP